MEMKVCYHVSGFEQPLTLPQNHLLQDCCNCRFSTSFWQWLICYTNVTVATTHTKRDSCIWHTIFYLTVLYQIYPPPTADIVQHNTGLTKPLALLASVRNVNFQKLIVAQLVNKYSLLWKKNSLFITLSWVTRLQSYPHSESFRINFNFVELARLSQYRHCTRGTRYGLDSRQEQNIPL
jgi:hypothetical protein